VGEMTYLSQSKVSQLNYPAECSKTSGWREPCAIRSHFEILAFWDDTRDNKVNLDWGG